MNANILIDDFKVLKLAKSSLLVIEASIQNMYKEQEEHKFFLVKESNDREIETMIKDYELGKICTPDVVSVDHRSDQIVVTIELYSFGAHEYKQEVFSVLTLEDDDRLLRDLQ